MPVELKSPAPTELKDARERAGLTQTAAAAVVHTTLLARLLGGLFLSSLSARFHELIVAVCGKDAYQEYEWPSLHEVRSVSARTYMAEGMPVETVQTLLGHKAAEMTAICLDDRGLSAKEWKTVEARAAETA